jgi:hypothetical protein
MDRLAGVAVGETVSTDKRLFQLVTPYGLAVDSTNHLYVADSKVHAVFIFDTETKELRLIKNGVEARFGLITGLAIDDSDRLFVADSEMRRVMVFDPKHVVEGSISEGLASPAGLAIDNENRSRTRPATGIRRGPAAQAAAQDRNTRQGPHLDYAGRFLQTHERGGGQGRNGVRQRHLQ